MMDNSYRVVGVLFLLSSGWNRRLFTGYSYGVFWKLYFPN